MKSFPDLDLTSATLAPNRLVVITRRDGAIKRIAEVGDPDSIVVGGDTYVVVPGFEIGGIRHTLGGEAASTELSGLHADGATFDTRELAGNFYDGALVQIFVTSLLLPSTPGLAFTGTIQPGGYDTDNKFSFDVRGLATKSTGLFVPTSQPMCRTDLFSSLCQVDPSGFTFTDGVVDTIIDNHNFTVSGLASPPADDYFNLGVGVTENGFAFEVANWSLSSLQITTFLPVNYIVEEGMQLTLYAGCDRTDGANGCGKFSNFLNFQGENHVIGPQAAEGS